MCSSVSPLCSIYWSGVMWKCEGSGGCQCGWQCDGGSGGTGRRGMACLCGVLLVLGIFWRKINFGKMGRFIWASISIVIFLILMSSLCSLLWSISSLTKMLSTLDHNTCLYQPNHDLNGLLPSLNVNPTYYCHLYHVNLHFPAILVHLTDFSSSLDKDVLNILTRVLAKGPNIVLDSHIFYNVFDKHSY